jgi:CheY-like chemotaxis protein
MTFLVIEDETLIRLDIVDRLQAAGFEVEQAGDAAEAIRLLELNRAINVVFTDINMPGDMDGLALLHVIRERWPPTILIVCSGNERPEDTWCLPARCSCTSLWRRPRSTGSSSRSLTS